MNTYRIGYYTISPNEEGEIQPRKYKWDEIIASTVSFKKVSLSSKPIVSSSAPINGGTLL